MDIGIRTYGNAALQRRYFQSPGEKTNGGFLTEMLKTKAAGGGLDSVYDRLSPVSQKALEDLKTGRNDMTKVQWNGLCRELKDMGVISQTQLDYSRADFHLVPLVSDGRGGITAPEIMKEFLEGGNPDRFQWKGNPLEYLDEWIETLRESRDKLSTERWPDGELKYKDLSPFTDQINDCQKVADVLRELLNF